MTPPRWLALVLWLALMALAVVIVGRAHYTADLSAFLPRAPSARQQLLVEQLRDGPASRVLLMAIEGADAAARAQLSMATARQLRNSRGFLTVNNGESVNDARDRAFVFKHRYLLSEAVTPEHFTVGALTSSIDDTIALLASPVGFALKSLLPEDPTGETLQVLNQLDRSARPHTVGGVWASADGRRALLVTSMRAPGSDIDAAERAVKTIRADFARAQDAASGSTARDARLVITGSPLFAVAARDTIRREAVRLSILSTSLIVTLLLIVYRSLPLLLLGLLPVTSGALAGIAAVAAGFGAVHGITLAFGITLIGESVDYSVYLFVQSTRTANGAFDTARAEGAMWRTILLGVLTSVCGFASLLPSGFPGLAQLGLYSIAGLVVAAAVTRFVLPGLIPRSLHRRNLTPLGERVAVVLRHARAARWTLGIVAIGAALVLFVHRDTLWNRDLAALSPVSARARALDTRLRTDLGAPDVSDFVVVAGDDLQTVLRASEKVAARLAAFVSDRTIGGFDSPTHYLPSDAAQSLRRASLPDSSALRLRLKAATASLPVSAARLEPFILDAAEARAAPLLRVSDLEGTSFAAGFDALTMHEGTRWAALMPLHATEAGTQPSAAATDKIRAAVENAAPGKAFLLNLKNESDALYSSYLSEALRLSAGGFAAIIVLLLLTLRSPRRVVAVVAPLVLAVVTVASALLLAGRTLTILHLIGMLLIVAVGSNYALFFDRGAAPHSGGTPSLTLASLVIANATTVVGFGVLAFSAVPVLAALGATVAPGAFLALAFAAAMSARPSAAR
ncbi:MAG TPA: MMPL family transporter [Steroidobacteraceae bacterium]